MDFLCAFSAEAACFGYSYSTCTAEKVHLSKPSVLDKRPAWILRFILSCVPYSISHSSTKTLLMFCHCFFPYKCIPVCYRFNFYPINKDMGPGYLTKAVEHFHHFQLMSFQSRSLQKSSAFFFCFATDWENKNIFWQRV